MDKPIDKVLNEKDYAEMPNYYLLKLAMYGDKEAWRTYLRRTQTNKSDTVTPEFSIEEDEE